MDLTKKYRPATFEDVLGQEAVIHSLTEVIKHDGVLPPCLLFSGTPGVGKTTIARIAAGMVGCSLEDNSIIEINGAAKTGIQDMREVLDVMGFKQFGKNQNRVVIIDEAHRLSANAWDSLLKMTEEPPVGSSWIFCSTEPTKIPKAILTRCVPPSGYLLKKVPPNKIHTLLKYIVAEEHFNIDKSIVQLITMKCEGSPRQAIKWLEALYNETSLTQAQDLLKSIGTGDEPPAIIALCRALASHKPWAEAIATIRDCEEEAETIRIVVTNYFKTVILRSKDMDESMHGLRILHAFSKPCYPPDKLAPILIAMATILIAD